MVQLQACNIHLLVWVVYCLMLHWPCCVLAILVPNWAFLDPDKTILFHWVWTLLQDCCTIWLFHLCLVGSVSAVLVVFLTLLNGSCSVYIVCLAGTSYGFVSSLFLSEKVPLKHPCLWTHHWINCIFLLSFQHL